MGNFRSLSLATATLCATSFCIAQQPQSGTFKTHLLTGNVYWVEGGGGNSGVIVGDKGVIVIDAKMTADGGKQLLDAVAKITPKAITTVIITHRDLDHIGGLAAFPKGIEIIAHKVDAGFEAPIPPNMKAPTIVPPTRILTTNKEVHSIDGVRMQLLHWAPAHTSGDTVVYLPTQKIVFTGDILDVDFPAGHVHVSQHGSAAGWIESVQGMLALDANRYVPGHGDVQTKQGFESHLKSAEAERAQVKQMIAQGKSLAEIQTATGDPGPNGSRSEAFSTALYNDLTRKP